MYIYIYIYMCVMDGTCVRESFFKSLYFPGFGFLVNFTLQAKQHIPRFTPICTNLLGRCANSCFTSPQVFRMKCWPPFFGEITVLFPMILAHQNGERSSTRSELAPFWWPVKCLEELDPIPSMYCIFPYIGLICMENVGKYTIDRGHHPGYSCPFFGLILLKVPVVRFKERPTYHRGSKGRVSLIKAG